MSPKTRRCCLEEIVRSFFRLLNGALKFWTALPPTHAATDLKSLFARVAVCFASLRVLLAVGTTNAVLRLFCCAASRPGVNFMEKTITLRNTEITFSIWDLGGQREFLSMLPLVRTSGRGGRGGGGGGGSGAGAQPQSLAADFCFSVWGRNWRRPGCALKLCFSSQKASPVRLCWCWTCGCFGLAVKCTRMA